MNITLDTQKGQFYCDKEVVFLGAFLVLAVYNDQTCFLAGQGFNLDDCTGFFPDETVALETAFLFFVDWLHPSGL